MKTLKSVIEDIKSLRGADVTIFGQPTRLDSEVDKFTIDVIDVLEALKDYEIDVEKIDVEELGFYTKADNTYNWNSPISNDINFEIYNADGYYVCIRVHRYGDVRGNYTDDVWFYFNNDYTFYELVSETTIYETVEIDGKSYNVDINVFSEGFEVFDADGECVCTAYGYDEADIIESIKENL